MKHNGLFEALKSVPASRVAEDAGIPLRRRGERAWACCPLHGERTPSMCFYADGRWHCFGCNQGGDAVALFAALNRLTMGEAARALAAEHGKHGKHGEHGEHGEHGVAPPQRAGPPPIDRSQWRRALATWRSRRWGVLCAIRHAAREVLSWFCDKEDAWEHPLFNRALRAIAEADFELCRMEKMDTEDLIELYEREVDGNVD